MPAYKIIDISSSYKNNQKSLPIVLLSSSSRSWISSSKSDLAIEEVPRLFPFG